MHERPKQSTRHDRAERNDPNTGHLLENKEITIRAQAGAAVKEKELLAERFVNKINKKEREKETKKSRKSQFVILYILLTTIFRGKSLDLIIPKKS